MRKSSWNYYGVRLIYQAIITGQPIAERIDENYSDTHTFFEESIMLVRAQSFEHAYTIAERKAHDNNDTHINPYGQTVEWKLVDAINCYLIDYELTNGIELFSSYTPIKKEITPAEYLMQKYAYNLDDYNWNEEQREKQIRLQWVLRNEQFNRTPKAAQEGASIYASS